jgi:ribulose-5-phosphate 4-epimerase/fuculose-1-phosphate aldolase
MICIKDYTKNVSKSDWAGWQTRTVTKKHSTRRNLLALERAFRGQKASSKHFYHTHITHLQQPTNHLRWSDPDRTMSNGVKRWRKVLKDSAAVLLRAHGDAVVGASLEEAILRTIRLAFVGELAHMAVAHDEPLYLDRG